MKRIGLSTSFAVTALVAAMSTASVAGAGVTDEDILNDQMSTDDVVTNGLGVQGQRFSPLTKLNSDNVQELRPVWSFSFGGEKQRGQESQPMVKDGVMYVTGSYSRVFAVDVKTGEERRSLPRGSRAHCVLGCPTGDP